MRCILFNNRMHLSNSTNQHIYGGTENCMADLRTRRRRINSSKSNLLYKHIWRVPYWSTSLELLRNVLIHAIFKGRESCGSSNRTRFYSLEYTGKNDFKNSLLSICEFIKQTNHKFLGLEQTTTKEQTTKTAQNPIKDQVNKILTRITYMCHGQYNGLQTARWYPPNTCWFLSKLFRLFRHRHLAKHPIRETLPCHRAQQVISVEKGIQQWNATLRMWQVEGIDELLNLGQLCNI